MKETLTPLKIVRILADGQFHSGEVLGSQLGMSRAAINQHIQILEQWGISIQRVTGKGYCLAQPLNLLNEEEINQVLGQHPIEVIPVIDSTNQYLLERTDRLKSGDACVAEYQSSGRGRRGRKWFSPFGANLYLSMYWRLEQGPAAAMGMSLVIGIVLAEALQALGADDVRVKWPNDLYLHNKKLAGILVELNGKAGDIAHVVIGAGINIAMKAADENLIDQQWISLNQLNLDLDRNKVTVLMIQRLREALTQFEQEGFSPFIERWKKLDNFMDKEIQLIIGDHVEKGICRGINQQGALLLEQEGVIKPWVGGEISLRAQ